MPKLFGLNLVGVLIASVAFFMVGWLWYGIIFMDAWMAEMGYSSADTEPESPLWMVFGFLITVMQVIGIGLVLKWKNVSGIGAAMMTAVILWFFFALPFSAYGYLYNPSHSTLLLTVDGSHLLVGWVISAVILSLMK